MSRTSTAITELMRRFENGVVLLSKFSPDHQVIYCRDVEKCFFGKAPSIALVENAFGRQTAMSWMEIQLNNLSEFSGCKEKLTTQQIAETAAMILDGYPYYKLTEFMLFFQRFKRCEYGRFYGAVDPMVILQSLSLFNEQRAQAIEERSKVENEKQKEAEDRAAQEIRQRYTDRVPDAWTDNAAIDFLQYQLLGYDKMNDTQLVNEIYDLKSGRKSIPQDVRQMLDSIKGAFDLKG